MLKSFRLAPLADIDGTLIEDTTYHHPNMATDQARETSRPYVVIKGRKEFS